MCEPFLDILPKSTVNFDHAYLSMNGSFNAALPRNYIDSCLPRTPPTEIPKFHLISWCGNYAFQKNLYTWKLGEIPFFSAVILYENMEKSYIKIT